MEEVLKRELCTVELIGLGRSGGGCISDGQSYRTDSGKVFVKYNTDSKVGRSVGKGAWLRQLMRGRASRILIANLACYTLQIQQLPSLLHPSFCCLPVNEASS